MTSSFRNINRESFGHFYLEKKSKEEESAKVRKILNKGKEISKCKRIEITKNSIST
jgi:hypothetical protein